MAALVLAMAWLSAWITSSSAWSPAFSVQATLTATDGGASDQLGYAVALDGNTLVAGAPGHDHGGVSDTGAVYVYVRSGSTWSQQAELVPSDVAFQDRFGSSVAVDGDTVVVGSPHDDDLGSGSGSVYVFTRSGTTWTQQAKLLASDGSTSDALGHSVAVDGDTLATGSRHDMTSRGSAFVYTRSGTTWTQQAKLVASDGANYDRFGHVIDLHLDTVVVGSYMDDDPTAGADAGSAYVFTRSGTTWSQQAKLLPSDVAAGDWTGYGVSVWGDTVAVGAVSHDLPASGAGAVYAFTRAGTAWSQQAKLQPTGVGGDDRFGIAVSVQYDTLIAGGEGADSAASNAGAAYAFRRTGSSWTQEDTLVDPAAYAGDTLGAAVDIDGDTAAVGAYLADRPDSDTGAVLAFDAGYFSAITHNSANTFAAASTFSWEPVAGGATLNANAARAGERPVMIDVGGVPWVVWIEHDGTNYEVRVAKLNADASAWEQVVGGASPINVNAGKTAENPHLALVGGVVHVTWAEFDTSATGVTGGKRQVWVKKLRADGTAWDLVGGTQLNASASQHAYLPMLADIGGIPWVAWYEVAATEDIRVKRLRADGTAWETVAGGSVLDNDSTKRAFVARIANVGGVPYVAWVENPGTGNQQVWVKRLNAGGTAWEQPVAGPLNVDSTKDTRDPAIAVIGGVPWVAWRERDAASIYQVRVAKLGATWEAVGTGASPVNYDSTKSAVFVTIADVGGVPHVSWAEPDASSVNQARVTRLSSDGTTWDRILASRSANANASTSVSRAVVAGVADEPWLAWHEGSPSQVRVARW